MCSKRTDLAVEAKEIWSESAEDQTRLEGVKATDAVREGYPVTSVNILDEKGEAALGKPCGTYITIELKGFAEREGDSFGRAARALSGELAPVLHLDKQTRVLVAGLGNYEITPDSIGPRTMESTMVTRHLVERLPEQFGNFRQVSAISTGVLGTTGIESVEILRGVVERSKPDCVIVVDALASRRLSRVCTTIQIADTGITPGSGVGNSRAAINRDVLGVPVIAIGVPTVVDAGTLAADIMEEAGKADLNPDDLSKIGGNMIVTPKEIDTHVGDISKVLGYGINLALHEGLSIDDVTTFLS